MNIGVHYLFEMVFLFLFFRYIPRSGIAGSYGSSIFSFLRNLRTVLHSDCTNLHFINRVRVREFPFSTSSPMFVICVLLMTAILTCARCYLIVVSICISLMISDVEHLFMCPLAICISSLEKYLFSSSAHFKIRFFLMLSCLSYLYMLDINPLLVIEFANIVFHSVVCLFFLSVVSFAVQKLLSKAIVRTLEQWPSWDTSGLLYF